MQVSFRQTETRIGLISPIPVLSDKLNSDFRAQGLRHKICPHKDRKYAADEQRNLGNLNESGRANCALPLKMELLVEAGLLKHVKLHAIA